MALLLGSAVGVLPTGSRSAGPGSVEHSLQGPRGALGGATTSTTAVGSPSVVSVGVGEGPAFEAYDSENGYVYVTNEVSGNVSVIDGTTVIGTVGVGASPTCVLYDSETGEVYVSNSGSSNVSVIDGTRVVGTVTVGTEPSHLGLDLRNGYVYVVNDLEVSVINGTTLVGTVVIGSGYFGAAGGVTYDPQDGLIYVVDTFGQVSIIDGTTLVGTVIVGMSPTTSTYDPQDGFVYVNCQSGNLTILNGTKVIAWITLGTGVIDSTYDPGTGDLYVAAGDVYEVRGTEWLGTLNTGGSAYSGTMDSGDGLLYVMSVNYLPSSMDVVYDMGVVGTLRMGAVPSTGVYDDRNGDVYWVSTDDNVSVILPRYPVTFVEHGLPAGSEWWVNMTGSRLIFSNTTTLPWTEANGTYPYVGQTLAQNYSNGGGSFAVDGANVTVSLPFALPPPPTFLGLPATDGYYALGFGIIAVGSLAAAAIVLSSFKGKSPPGIAEPSGDREPPPPP